MLENNSENDKESETKIFGLIKSLLTLLLVLAILSSFVFITYQFVIPTPDEYDDPETDVQESFPWNPNIVSNFTRVWHLFWMGVARHVSLMPQYVTTIKLISMVGYVFFVLFIYTIRRTFLSQEKLGIHNYVEWAIGSIVGAIIYVGGTIPTRTAPDTGIAIILLSAACLIIYLVHPHVGLFFALRERIRGNVEKRTEKNQR